ncbi:MAG: RbsD/FucU family protein [Roseinatronobacter sp.]
MLIGIDPRLTPDLLHALAAMGHGDSLTLVDANYPAQSNAQATRWGRCIDFGGTSTQALAAILSVLPLDAFDPETPAVQAMQQVHDPDTPAAPVIDAQPLIAARGFQIALTERHAFYAAAQRSFAVVRTLERRFYGCFILRKGVIGPED